MNAAVSTALALVLLKDGVPLGKRHEALRPLFDPPPGELVKLDPKEVRDFGPGSRTKVSPSKLRGYIRVRPPKGQCLTLRKSPEDEDLTVCKAKDLVFTLGEIDRAGRLSWTVITGEGDFGTELSWRTPYRLAIVERMDTLPEDPPTYLFIDRCEVDSKTPLGRRVKISFFSGEEWTLRLPPEDDLLPQPDPVPNLYIARGKPKGGIPADGAGKPAEGDKPKAEEHGTKEVHGDGHSGEKNKPKGESISEPAKAMQREEEQFEDRKSWSLPMRDSYKVDGSMFSDGIALKHGAQGVCRYRYDGPDDDPDVGRMECHDVGGYRMIFAPLTCIGKLRKGSAKGI
jgi:hypothetical protein